MTDIRAPVIGLTCREIRSHKFATRLGLSESYLKAILRAGGAPLLIPPLPNQSLLRSAYEACDGLLLPGGGDIDPAYYDETVHEKCGMISPEQDSTELALARWAADDGTPLLAICRGIQVLNVALGGSLYQDLASQCPKASRHDWYPGYPRDRLSHTVVIAPGSCLADILGEGSIAVNSLHHQALKQVAPRLRVTACATDGIIEAVEDPTHHFALGVQWHPEELAPTDERAQRLFDALVAASRK